MLICKVLTMIFSTAVCLVEYYILIKLI